jgi:potassium channel subfamily K
MNLAISIIAFGIMWAVGAVIFWALEDDLTYFQALYFGFTSLLTIGYGDITPTTNASRQFFVVWSLLAVPTMTSLISKMSDTLVDGYKRCTNIVADWTVLPQSGHYRAAISRCSGTVKRICSSAPSAYSQSQLERGQEEQTEPPSPPQEQSSGQLSLESLARSPRPSTHRLGQELVLAIQKTIKDAVSGQRKTYSYEEWVEFTRLIQLTQPKGGDGEGDENIRIDEDEYGLLNWDWIGQHSPLLAEKTEPEWVLDRLCESLGRFVARVEP